MNTEHRFTLEKGSRKHLCPNCNKKSFVLYIDTVTGDYLPSQYGRCDRESKCNYFLNPYLDGYAKEVWEQEQGQKVTGVTKVTVQKKVFFHTNPKQQPKNETVYFDFDTFKQTLQPDRYEKNVFIQNLLSRVQFPFEVNEVTKVIELYRLGTITNGYRAGANTFPFIDTKQNVRAIQLKQFDESNHTTGTDFLHSIIEKYHNKKNMPLPDWLEAYIKQEKRISCLFGEHLLSKYHSNPIALVEAPKTAIYGTLYFGLPETPESLIWLAVYNKSSFSFDKLKALQGRFVYVFPDLSKDGSTFKEWEAKAKEYENRLPGTRFIFSDLLEQLAPERDKANGNDIADYLIKQDWRLFRKQNVKKEQQPKPNKTLHSNNENFTKLYLESKKNLIKPHIENFTKLHIPDNLQLMIDTLGLEYNLNEMQSFLTPPQPKNESELIQLSLQTIGQHNMKHKNEIPHFEMMFSSGIIKEATPIRNNYYLSNSTPF